MTIDHKGRYCRGVETVERDAEACRLRSRGYTYQQIADEMRCYVDRSHARKAVQRALRDTMQEPADDLRRLELDRLDRLWRASEDVLDRSHLAVSVGKVVGHWVPVRDERGAQLHDDTGKPVTEWVEVVDDMPVLQALDRMLKIQARRAALLGLDAPAKSRVEVVTQDQIEAEIERLQHEIAEQERSHR